MTPFSSSLLPRPFLALLLAIGGPGLFACSSTNAAPTGNAACTALVSCCAELSLTNGEACLMVAGTQVEDTCATTLLTYEAASLCGASRADGGHPSETDGGLPCELTGTCPGTGKEAGTGDASATSECHGVGSCQDGETYEECTTVAGSTCSEAYVFSGGARFVCASCSSCEGALASAQAQCGTSPPDAGDDATVDAGEDATPDADVCGTVPVLHPETVGGGPYCPFTAAGNVHCPGQECCEAPSTSTGGSTCETLGTSCPVAGSIQWQCDGPVDCESSSFGPICCAAGTVANDPTCGFDRGSGFTGSHCATSCGSGELSICSESTDPCASGTCTAFKIAGIVIGTCQ